MKRLLTVSAMTGVLLLVAAPLAQASWSAVGVAPAARQTAGISAAFRTPVLTTSGAQGGRTVCNSGKVTARWTFAAGGRTPASYTLTVGGAADAVSIAGTATSATSSGTYSGNKTVTVTAVLGSWREVSNSVTVTC